MSNNKKTFYFSHDGNARNDEKIVAVRMKYGVEGYGIYFMLLEMLLESSDYILAKDYNVIAFSLRVGAEKVKAIVEDYGLFEFTEDGKNFYSESFIERMKPLDNIREQRRQAGLASAAKRAAQQERNGKQPLLNKTSTTVEKSSKTEEKPNSFFAQNSSRKEENQRPLQNTLTTDGVNFNKVKESKVKNISPLTEEIVRGGNNFFDSIIPPLDNIERNWERFKEILQSYKCSEPDFRKLTALSDYGKIGHPIWQLFAEVRNSNGKINQPIRFIMSRLT